jgi:hypothetical protein
VGWRARLFELLPGEDVDANQVDVIGACAYLDNLAWATLDDNVALQINVRRNPQLPLPPKPPPNLN